LEPATIKENTLRGFGRTANQARQTHCKNGHPLSGDNLVPWILKRTGFRMCLICNQAYQSEWHRKDYLKRKAQGKL
jgi:hypothetical protein